MNIDAKVRWTQHEPSPECAIPVERGSGREVLPTVAKRSHNQRIKPGREPTKRRQIAVVVVVVTQEHGRNLGQVLESHTRLPHTSRTEACDGVGTFRVHEYIGSVRIFPAAV